MGKVVNMATPWPSPKVTTPLALPQRGHTPGPPQGGQGPFASNSKIPEMGSSGLWTTGWPPRAQLQLDHLLSKLGSTHPPQARAHCLWPASPCPP